VFFWNNLPPASVVDIYLPGGQRGARFLNYRNLRHAPGDREDRGCSHLRLQVAGPSGANPPFFGDDLAGLVTVTCRRESRKARSSKWTSCRFARTSGE